MTDKLMILHIVTQLSHFSRFLANRFVCNKKSLPCRTWEDSSWVIYCEKRTVFALIPQGLQVKPEAECTQEQVQCNFRRRVFQHDQVVRLDQYSFTRIGQPAFHVDFNRSLITVDFTNDQQTCRGDDISNGGTPVACPPAAMATEPPASDIAENTSRSKSRGIGNMPP